MRTAVVGHLEWVDFLRVDHVPGPGQIVHAHEWWSEPAGGGPGAAVQLLKLAGNALFFTALGNDGLGARAHDDLVGRGLQVAAAFRAAPTRRAVTHVDASGERTITVLGERLGPHGEDALPWSELERVDACYFTAGDLAALRWARRARVLIATARAVPLLREADVELDALVGSAVDPAEAYQPGDLQPAPRLVVQTEGAAGGTFFAPDDRPTRYEPSTPPGAVVDRYGAGDSFAGGLAYALAAGRAAADAVAFAARCGAAAVTGRGPYAGQLQGAAEAGTPQ